MMASSVEDAKYTGNYTLPLDVNQIKQHFADLMAELEGLPKEEPEESTESGNAEVIAVNAAPVWLKRASVALAVVPVVGLVAVAAIGLGKTLRK